MRPPRLWALLATLAITTSLASVAWAGDNDEQVRALVAEILANDFEAGRNRAAMDNLEAAKIACDSDGCSKQVLAEVAIAKGIVQASGLKHHDEAVASFKQALASDPKAAPPKERMDEAVKAAFEEASGSAEADPVEPEAAPLPRVAVYVEADDPAQAEKLTREAVGTDYELVDSAAYAAELKEGGLRGPMRIWFGSERLKTRLLQAVTAANEKTEAAAVVLGMVDGERIQLVVVDASGKIVHDQTADVKAAAIASVIKPKLRELFPAQGEAEAPEVHEEPDEPDEPDVPFDGGDWGRAFVIARAGFEIGMRDFSYVESPDNSQNLRAYDVAPVAGFGLDAELYPGAMSGIPVVSDLGVEMGFGLSPKVRSSTVEGQTFSSSWSRFELGGRARLRTGSAPWPVLGMSGTFGVMAYDFEADDPAAEPVVAELPDVSYRWLRAGVDGRSQVDRFSLRLGAGYLGTLLGGEVYTRFRDPEPVGFELEGGASVRIWDQLEGGIDVTYTRIVYSFVPDASDEYAASGSLDQFVRARLGFAYAY